MFIKSLHHQQIIIALTGSLYLSENAFVKSCSTYSYQQMAIHHLMCMLFLHGLNMKCVVFLFIMTVSPFCSKVSKKWLSSGTTVNCISLCVNWVHRSQDDDTVQYNTCFFTLNHPDLLFSAFFLCDLYIISQAWASRVKTPNAQWLLCEHRRRIVCLVISDYIQTLLMNYVYLTSL